VCLLLGWARKKGKPVAVTQRASPLGVRLSSTRICRLACAPVDWGLREADGGQLENVMCGGAGRGACVGDTIGACPPVDAELGSHALVGCLLPTRHAPWLSRVWRIMLPAADLL
jgi:hypothetical protein